MSDINKIPVILDTDIGSDIDDSWALAMLMRSPVLDTKLVVSCIDNAVYKAKCICRQLDDSGFSHIPVGIGISTTDAVQELDEWVKDYDLDSYKNLRRDGIDAMIEAIMQSDEMITLITIGPLTNIAAALDREPEIASRCRIVAVGGSIYCGHRLDVIEQGSDYNIRADIPAARKVLSAGWDITLAPLDVTAHIVIGDDNYQKILSKRADDKIIATVLECFDFWMVASNATYYKTHTTSLYDTVAIYIAEMKDYNLITEDHKLIIDDGGYTLDSDDGFLCHCAVYWRYKDMFYKFLTERLLGER